MYFIVKPCVILINMFSSLLSRHVGNKHGGGKDDPFLISVVPGIVWCWER